MLYINLSPYSSTFAISTVASIVSQLIASVNGMGFTCIGNCTENQMTSTICFTSTACYKAILITLYHYENDTLIIECLPPWKRLAHRPSSVANGTIIVLHVTRTCRTILSFMLKRANK